MTKQTMKAFELLESTNIDVEELHKHIHQDEFMEMVDKCCKLVMNEIDELFYPLDDLSATVCVSALMAYVKRLTDDHNINEDCSVDILGHILSKEKSELEKQ